MSQPLLTKAIRVLLFLLLLFAGLYYARPFLAPLVFAALFSMLLMPLTRRWESMGMKRGLAVFVSLVLFLLIAGTVVYLLVMEIKDISKDSARTEQQINVKMQQLKVFVSNTFGLSPKKQEELISGRQSDGSGRWNALISGGISSIGSFLIDAILVTVYTFLFLFYRSHLKKFILRMVPEEEKRNAGEIMGEARIVAQKYITGLSWMILCLWIMYSIGFSIVGVRNAVFFAVLCGLLEIVPFVGNLTGSLLTILSVVVQGGSTEMIIGVVITYALVQFLQTYILEPLVVGKGVSLNPLFTIAGIVLGELLWGISGMVLAIPMLGIVKIICDHVEPLKPYGFLIGSDRRSRTGIINRFRKIPKKVVDKPVGKW
jgi:predicted PurR-regulated permease PerM